MRIQSALAIGALLFAALPLIAQTTQSAAPAQAARPAEHGMMPRPHNLQVLPKDISGPELMATMRGYGKALGVECGFCHVEDPQTKRFNFASDAKPDKNIARTMIRMTSEINSKYLSTVNDPDASVAQKTVTCGTCHRGNMMPVPFGSATEMKEHPSMPAKSE